MKMRPHSPSRRSMQGLSLVELMIAMTLGLIVLAALVSVFANTSASRGELERTSRQIENGRFAMEILTDDIRHAGFYGEANVKGRSVPSSLSFDPNGPSATLCHNDGSTAAESDYWKRAMVIHVQGFDNGAGVPWCFPAGTLKPNTDVVAIRRAATCEAGFDDCPAPVPLENYVQVAKCKDETPLDTFIHFGVYGTNPFTLREKDCATPARLRRYIQRIYYIATDNGRGVALPTLTRLELIGPNQVVTPMVEGVEEMNIEYGLDLDVPPDGAPEVYTADPNTYNGCTNAACAEQNWANVITVRIHLLARNTETSPNYADTKQYKLGLDASGAAIVKVPNDNYRRHVYSAVVRVANAGGRRDTP